METRVPADRLGAVRKCFDGSTQIGRFYDLIETLLWKNEAVAKALDAARVRRELPRDGLNDRQMMLEAIALISLQVPNGGLNQFFWNCPEWTEMVAVSLREIGMSELAECLDRSTAELVERFGTYSEFRKRDSLEAYSECARQFSFDEFDHAYFRLEEEVYVKTIEFVSSHLSDFVVLADSPSTSPR